MFPEPTELVDSPNANHAPSQLEEVEIIEEGTDDQVTDEGQASNDTDNLVEVDPHWNDNHVSVTAESLTSSSQEDAPKKSYASIVSSQTKKGTTIVYVPADTAKVVPAKTEKQPLNPTAEATGSESSAPITSDNAPESKDAQDEGILFSLGFAYLCERTSTTNLDIYD